MTQAFHDKLAFVMKALSVSRGRLASDLNVDKSIVSRWARGLVRPSDDNLARLTSLIARRVPAFTILDWDRDLTSLAEVLGVAPDIAASARPPRLASGRRQEVFEQILDATERRAGAYEGFYRSTRPYASQPGLFVHDYMIVRREDDGLIGFTLTCDSVSVEGWVLPQQGQLFIVGTESETGSLAFCILNGVNGPVADVIDGVMLSCALDAGRTPTATAMLFERVGHLTGDREADDRRFAELARSPALAPPGSVPAEIVAHLTRDFGPAQLAIGGDLLLRLPLGRSRSRSEPLTTAASEESAPGPRLVHLR